MNENSVINFEWIDCNRFIPDKNGEYLTVRADESGQPLYSLCQWNGRYKTFTVSESDKIIHPTHWAKLPEPPSSEL